MFARQCVIIPAAGNEGPGGRDPVHRSLPPVRDLCTAQWQGDLRSPDVTHAFASSFLNIDLKLLKPTLCTSKTVSTCRRPVTIILHEYWLYLSYRMLALRGVFDESAARKTCCRQQHATGSPEPRTNSHQRRQLEAERHACST